MAQDAEREKREAEEALAREVHRTEVKALAEQRRKAVRDYEIRNSMNGSRTSDGARSLESIPRVRTASAMPAAVGATPRT